MIRAVIQRDFDVHRRIARQNAALHRFVDAFFNRRNVLARHRAADDLIHEFEARATRQRLDANPGVAELTAPAALFLMAAMHFGFAFDGFEIGNFRRRQDDIHAELTFQLFDDHFDMQLPHAGNQKFFGAFVALELQRHVFFHQAVQPHADFVFIAAIFRVDRKGNNRARHLIFRQQNPFRIQRQRVACAGFSQFHDCAEIADSQRRDFILLFALHAENMADAFFLFFGQIVQLSIGRHRSGIDPEQVDAPGKRVNKGFEHLRDHMCIRIKLAFGGVFRSGNHAFHRRPF